MLTIVPICSISGHLFTTIPQNTRKGVKLLGPIIEARLNQYEAHGKDWVEKPVKITLFHYHSILLTLSQERSPVLAHG